MHHTSGIGAGRPRLERAGGTMRDMAQDREAAIDELHAVPLGAFVAERKRLAASVRKAGDREAAGEIAKWPKPTAPAWALNALVREEDEAARAWLAAADALRDASTGGGGDLRTAMAAHREATVRLVEAATGRAGLSAPMRERVRALLGAATMDAALADALRAGRIVEGQEEEPELPAVAVAPGKPGKPGKPAKPGKSEAKRKAAEREAKGAAEREATETAERKRRIEEAAAGAQRLRAEADASAAAVATTEERLDEAERALRRARSERDAAHEAAKEADRAASRAERDLEKLR